MVQPRSPLVRDSSETLLRGGLLTSSEVVLAGNWLLRQGQPPFPQQLIISD
ncbi:hypothetical protein ACFLZP_03270 [Patescibacteria group bacterium]